MSYPLPLRPFFGRSENRATIGSSPREIKIWPDEEDQSKSITLGTPIFPTPRVIPRSWEYGSDNSKLRV